MLSDELLTDKYRYEWIIIKYLEDHKNYNCTITELSTILDISSYKVEVYIEEINTNLRMISKKSEIFIQNTGEIFCFNIDYIVVKKLRLKYVEICGLLGILNYFFIDEMPMKKQVEVLHSSRTVSYEKYRLLKTILKDENLAIRKNRIIGDELNARSIFFSTYYELFNGIGNPFPKKIHQSIVKIMQQLSAYYSLNIPKTKELKLTIFIGIWLIRLQNRHFIFDTYIECIETDFIKWLKKIIQTTYVVPEDVLKKEISYFIMFCHFEIDDNIFISKFLEFDMYKDAIWLTEKFSSLFYKTFKIHLLDESILNELNNIHMKWLVYHFRNQSFVIKGDFNYFQEINPNIDNFIKDFIVDLESIDLFQSDLEKNKLYYDYLFLLVTKIPMEKIEAPLNICIDFSHGSNYNNYIKMMLQSLQSMNIVYESRISINTKLFLTDCAMDKLNCEQLIWKRPPTSNDWRDLGDLLIKIKEKQIER
ncbi:hypothetical protein IGI39_003085 [Enterococcus sp. AZ135]|uniref:helix-turn-helix domain-containing protein n=1 Tax=unclassified Enterococcus TaxID=2608891 RepID=UPI003F21961D